MSNYQPYDEDWAADMMKLPKKFIIEMFAKKCKETGWVDKKPKFTEDCILITAYWLELTEKWTYYVSLVEYNRMDVRWELFDFEGGEAECADDLQADYYMVIPMLKP